MLLAVEAAPSLYIVGVTDPLYSSQAQLLRQLWIACVQGVPDSLITGLSEVVRQ